MSTKRAKRSEIIQEMFEDGAVRNSSNDKIPLMAKETFFAHKGYLI